MEDIAEDISEFIVESINISDDTWKFSDVIRELSDKEIQLISSGLGIPKRFTSLATNALFDFMTCFLILFCLTFVFRYIFCDI